MKTIEELREFEESIASAIRKGSGDRYACHLSRGNEQQLINVFKNIEREDWVFSTWRAHYHALLHGVPEELLRKEILERGNSICLNFPKYNFFSSSIVGGCLPIAVGVAQGLKDAGSSNKAVCFVGDMAATTGAFHEALYYAAGHDLPVLFVIEDNGYSTNTPTHFPWGYSEDFKDKLNEKVLLYQYDREWPHTGVDA